MTKGNEQRNWWAFPVYALEVWREFLWCFVWTHFAVQLNLPINRCEDKAAAEPNTITPWTAFRTAAPSNEVKTRTKLTPVLAERTDFWTTQSLLTCPEQWPKTLFTSQPWRTTLWHHGGSMFWEGSRGNTLISAVSPINLKRKNEEPKSLNY